MAREHLHFILQHLVKVAWLDRAFGALQVWLLVGDSIESLNLKYFDDMAQIVDDYFLAECHPLEVLDQLHRIRL